jgi:hypothetical protein
MKLKLSPYLAAAACGLLAACSSGTAAVHTSASAAPSASCEAYLKNLSGQLGNVSTDAGRFQAAVNALSYAGKLPPACAQLATNADLMRLAAQAAGGH